MTNEEQQLETTRDLQREFWEALSNLEEILGVEIDGTADLSLATIATLIKGEPLADDTEEKLLNAAVEDARETFAGTGIEFEEEPDEEDRPTPSDDEPDICAICGMNRAGGRICKCMHPDEREEVDLLTCAACADPKNGRFPGDCTAEVAGVTDCRAEVSVDRSQE